jgi:hypothetical protein
MTQFLFNYGKDTKKAKNACYSPMPLANEN